MGNYKKIAAPAEPRVELHDALGLTGAEVSINRMAAGTQVPFVHSHKQNEEIYGFLAGRGTMTIDGEPVAVAEGDWMRVAPAAKRQLAAALAKPRTECAQRKTRPEAIVLRAGFSLGRGMSAAYLSLRHSLVMSSSVLPLVSGTSFHTKRAASTHIAP